MSIVRKLALALGKTLIVLSITVSVVGFLFISTLSKPDKIKGWLSESSLYPSVTQTIQDQLLKDNPDSNQLPKTVLNDTITKTFNAQVVQEFFEGSIDNIYVWLKDDTQKLNLKLDTNQLQKDFTQNVTNGLRSHLQNLPPCPANVVPSTDLINAQCLPSQIDIDEVLASVDTQLDLGDLEANGEGTEIIKFSPSSSDDTESPVTLEQELAPIKSIYNLLGVLPFITLGLFLIGVAIIVTFSKPRYVALRMLAISALFYGILYTVGGLLLPKIITSLTKSTIDSITEPALKESLSNLAKTIGKSIGSDLVIAGVVILIIGLVLLVSYVQIKKRSTKVHYTDTRPNNHKLTVHHPENNKTEQSPK